VTTGKFGEILNSGGGTLTLAGGISKNGSTLTLAGGAFNITTNPITGASAGSDLIVSGSTVNLGVANTYVGPTSVVSGGQVIVGINNAIPSNSAVTLGDASTTGTLTLGSFSNSIGSLAFGAGHGKVALAANQTASPQLAVSGAAALGSGNTLDLTGMSTTAGLYKLIGGGSSLTGTFGTVTGLNSAYTLQYGTVNANELDAQHKATIALALGSNTNVRPGSTTVNLLIGNTAPTGSAALNYTLGGVTGGGTEPAGDSGATTPTTGTYTSVAGVNSFNITASDANATNSPQTVGFTQSAYALASPTLNTVSPVAFGIVHVGATQTVSISNTSVAPAGYQDSLDTSGSGISNITAAGTNIAQGGTNTSGLVLTANAVGSLAGTLAIGYNSNHNGVAGLSDQVLTSGAIGVTGQANDYAQPTYTKTGGAGTLSNDGSTDPLSGTLTNYTLDFGTVALNSGVYTSNLKLTNAQLDAIYQDLLTGNFTVLSGSGFTFTASNFSNMAIGGNQAFNVNFNSAQGPGVFTEVLQLAPSSVNGSGSTNLSNIDLTFDASTFGAVVPEPTSLGLLAIGGLGLMGSKRKDRSRRSRSQIDMYT
jgi:hypothetical protein